MTLTDRHATLLADYRQLKERCEYWTAQATAANEKLKHLAGQLDMLNQLIADTPTNGSAPAEPAAPAESIEPETPATLTS